MKSGVLALFSLLAVFCSCNLQAQSVKAGVLVIGNSPAAFAAAIQSANSGVKTVLIDSGAFNTATLNESAKSMESGFYTAFLKHVETLQKYKVDSNQRFTPAFTASVLRAWTDTVKNLTRMPATWVVQVKKLSKGWEGRLNANRSFKVAAVVDASAGSSLTKLFAAVPAPVAMLGAKDVYASTSYRTSIATARTADGKTALVPLKALLTDKENFITLSSLPTVYTGQAAGAVAAYTAFYKSSTDKLNVRAIQNELLTYGAHIIRFDDLKGRDKQYRGIQDVALTGILKGRAHGDSFFFLPEQAVSAEELRAALKEHYSRSQIWFMDHKSPALSRAEVLSLIKFIASRGNELDREVVAGWNKSLLLPGKYEPAKTASRREVAALFNAYVKPLIIGVDQDGAIRR